MKTFNNLSTRVLPLFALLILVFSLAACQSGGPNTVQSGAETLPANEGQATASSQNPASPAEALQGDQDLPDPSVGIDQLSGFRQEFSLTLNGTWQGNSYEEIQTIAREIVNENEAIKAVQSAAGKEPVYVYTAQLGGFRYSQEREGAACRAESGALDLSVDPNPALRLPAAFGMQESGTETLGGRPAVHYTFDERSLHDPEGIVEQATGEVWLADDSSLVLRYDLTVEIESPDFSGTRSWSYQLTPLSAEYAIHLPDTCQPVLADLPVMPEAADMLQQPGFQRYFVDAERGEAIAFYYDRLIDLGWEALPGSSPDSANQTTAITALSFTQPYMDGGRVLVIALSEADGRLQVIAQTAITEKPVQSDVAVEPMEPDEFADEDDEEFSESEQPTVDSSANLADVPAYSGASTVSEEQGFRMLQVQAPVDDVAGFYEQELKSLGWTLDQKMDNAGVILLLWSKDGGYLNVTISDIGGATQIILTAD